MPEIVCQGHFEDSPSTVSGHDDFITFTDGLSASAKDWFIFFAVSAYGNGNGFNTIYVPPPHDNVFSQNFGGGTYVSAMVQAFGPGDSDFNTFRTEFGSLEHDILPGYQLGIHWTAAAGNLGPRIYTGVKWEGHILDNRDNVGVEHYPNFPVGYSDTWMFDGYEENIGTSFFPSVTVPKADRYWTRPTRAPQGRQGMWIAHVGADGRSANTFLFPPAGWTELVSYKASGNFNLSVFYRYFGPDNNNWNFQNVVFPSTKWQIHLGAYEIKTMLHMENLS